MAGSVATISTVRIVDAGLTMGGAFTWRHCFGERMLLSIYDQ
jgi:hypothetical protein